MAIGNAVPISCVGTIRHLGRHLLTSRIQTWNITTKSNESTQLLPHKPHNIAEHASELDAIQQPLEVGKKVTAVRDVENNSRDVNVANEDVSAPVYTRRVAFILRLYASSCKRKRTSSRD